MGRLSVAILLVFISLITMTTSQDPSAPDTVSPSPSPFHGSSTPPAPPPSDPSPASSPSPAQSPSSEPSPAPAFSGQNVVNLLPVPDDNLEERQKSGMSPGKKAGIAFGVIAGLCVVGLAGFVYKKRQQNIERSQYGYGRREIPLSSF